jgi:hypothetical protein
MKVNHAIDLLSCVRDSYGTLSLASRLPSDNRIVMTGALTTNLTATPPNNLPL